MEAMLDSVCYTNGQYSEKMRGYRNFETFQFQMGRTSLHLFVDCVRALYGDVSSGL